MISVNREWYCVI